jgi:hypothetical protein
MKRSIFIISLLVAAFLLSACGPSTMALKPEFWQTKERTIGVAIVPAPVAGAHRAGSEGLLDMAINKIAMGSLESHLQALKSDAFNQVVDKFVARLTERGIPAKKLDKPLLLDKFPQFNREESGDVFERDLRSLAASEKIDALVILSISQWGTVRNYYGFIPLGSPKGYCVGTGRLINLTSNALEWITWVPAELAAVDVDGEWDKPPDFPNVDTAIKKAVENAKVFLENDFFGLAQGRPVTMRVP